MSCIKTPTALDGITEILETLAVRTLQRSSTPQPSGDGSGKIEVNIGPNYIYAPGGSGGSGGGGGGGGLQVGGSKAIVSSKMCERKAVILKSKMLHEMQQYAVDCATQALEKYEEKLDVASYIKGEFNNKYKPYWHCFIGSNYTCSVNHDNGCYINFKLGQDEFLLFKCG